MDYEKKYKEALEVAKRKLCFDKAGMVDSFTPNDIYEMFPELKESEDEKIRQELIAIYSVGARGNMKTGDIPDKDIVAWLEKQGENHDDKYNITEIKSKHADGKLGEMIKEIKSTNKAEPKFHEGDWICDKSCTTLNKEAQPNMEIIDIQNGMYICDKGSFPVSQQDEYELVSKKIDTKLNDDSVSNELRAASFAHAKKEIKNPTCPDNEEFELAYTFEEGAKWYAAQKHSWSKDDEEMLDEIIDFFENGTVKLQHDLSLYASWLKSLKGRVKTQQEWTMQDEEELQIALDTLAKAGQHSSAKWLKNVCLVPQNKWKPSGVQMTVLDDVITNGHLPNVNQKILKGLQEQLRKLK